MIVAFVAVAFCLLGAVILSLYNEKKITKTITEKKASEEPVNEDILASDNNKI